MLFNELQNQPVSSLHASVPQLQLGPEKSLTFLFDTKPVCIRARFGCFVAARSRELTFNGFTAQAWDWIRFGPERERAQWEPCAQTGAGMATFCRGRVDRGKGWGEKEKKGRKHLLKKCGGG